MKEVNIRSWEIAVNDVSNENKDYYDSIFSQGNGYMGVRGYQPEGKKVNAYERSTFFSGFYEYIRTGITDMVNQPDFSSSQITLNGFNITDMRRTGFTEILNMQNGTLTWKYTVSDQKERETQLEVIRFLSMHDIHTAAIRFIITPINYSGDLLFETGIDAEVVNLPIADDQLRENTNFVSMWGEFSPHSTGVTGGLSVKTAYSKRETAMEYRLTMHGIPSEAVFPVIKEDYAGSLVKTALAQGNTYFIDKLISVYNFRDDISPTEKAIKSIRHCEDGFDRMLANSQYEWERIWKTADIELDTDDELQGAVRYNIFQLIQSDPAHDPYASIGARGLMHGRYKGCYFWDTEIFMFPFFLNTNPEAAKNLLRYRYHTLKDAVESSKRFSMHGARYSWMASDTGFEQCETWDTGCCEIHITADIVYAIGQYIEQTEDMDFFKYQAAEIFIQTARYWADRFTYDEKMDVYNLLFVKGPDEYCGVTTNDFYTVSMAIHNLELAISAVTQMQKDYRNDWEILQKQLGVTLDETAKWEAITLKAVRRYDEERKLWSQDDTFEKLERLDADLYKDKDIPLYHKINFDRLQRYQVLKQPAVLMLMALFLDKFSMEELQAAWDYYEPKTLHDSTLSCGIHALVAARIGNMEKAKTYFYKSVYLDLKDVMSNTAKEGIHTAALGATWQALVYGFAGLQLGAEGISCNPKLPDGIKGMRFCTWYGGNAYEVKIKDKEAEIIFLPAIEPLK